MEVKPLDEAPVDYVHQFRKANVSSSHGTTGAPPQSMPSQAEQIRQLKQKKGKKGKRAIKVQGVAVQEERVEPEKKTTYSVVSERNEDQMSQQAHGFEASEQTLK